MVAAETRLDEWVLEDACSELSLVLAVLAGVVPMVNAEPEFAKVPVTAANGARAARGLPPPRPPTSPICG